MLTKKEREEITERLKGINFLTDNEIYKAITGKCVSVTTTYNEDIKRMIKAILGLCDTSNMIELPRDRDGEVIHIGDVVYDDFGMEWEVSEFRFPFDGAYIYARTDGNYSTYRPKELTHKKPVTIASILALSAGSRLATVVILVHLLMQVRYPHTNHQTLSGVLSG